MCVSTIPPTFAQVKVLVDVRKWSVIAAAAVTATVAAAAVAILGRARGGGRRFFLLPLR